MKKGIITLMAVALLIPLATFAQPGPGDGPFCPQGRGMGQGPGMARQHGPGSMGQGRHMKGRGGRGFGDDQPQLGRILMMADELGLSEQQRGQLRQMQTDFRMQMIDREAEVEKAEINLRSLMMDKDAPEVDVDRAIDNVARFRADVQKLRYSHRKQMRGVLTADQLNKLQKMREERRGQRMERGMGMGHGKGQGMGQGQGPGRGQQPSAPGTGRHSMRGH
jgi:Spy/CpxP family protein refolding chaperone